jgi:hypothetical protein
MNVCLGARVAYHHRAAVARWMTKDFHAVRPGQEGRWGLFEGARKGARIDGSLTFETDLFADYPKQERGSRSVVNKTVMVWPEEGVGVVTGKVRRQRGTSHRASSGGGYMDGDFDPGYFDVAETFELYAIRHDLAGLDYILVPTWAVVLEPPTVPVVPS